MINFLAFLVTFMFVLVVSLSINLDVGTSKIIENIENDYVLSPINKKYKYFLNDFEVHYTINNIKVITNSRYNNYLCKNVNKYLSDEIVNLQNTERFIENECLKYKDKKYFNIILKEGFKV